MLVLSSSSLTLLSRMSIKSNMDAAECVNLWDLIQMNYKLIKNDWNHDLQGMWVLKRDVRSLSDWDWKSSERFGHHSEYQKRSAAFQSHCDDQNARSLQYQLRASVWSSQWVSKAVGGFSYSLWWLKSSLASVSTENERLVITVRPQSVRPLLVLTVMTKMLARFIINWERVFGHHSEYEKRPDAFDTHCETQSCIINLRAAFWYS